MTHPPDLAEIQRHPISWWIKSAAFSGIVVSMVLTWAYLKYGSLTTARDYAQGARLVADSADKSFGRLKKGQRTTLSIRISNLSQSPIAILGSKLSCTCLRVNGLPTTIAPSSSTNLEVEVIADNKKPGPVVESVQCFTDYPAQPRLMLRVSGQIEEMPAK